MPELAGLAADLKAAWHAPGVTMRSRQRIVRALITDIIADDDDEARPNRPDDPLARRSAFATEGSQAEERRTWPANR